MNNPTLPSIPAKRYFTIGEVSELCGVKPHVLRYWEQEFAQLKPIKRRGNRRYYQHHEVLLIRRIRNLLYDQGFTISGARQQLGNHAAKNTGSAQTAQTTPPKQQAGQTEELKLDFPETIRWPNNQSNGQPSAQAKLNTQENSLLPPLAFDAPDHTPSALPLRIVSGVPGGKSVNHPLSDVLLWKDYEQIRQELMAIHEILAEE